MAKSLRVSDHAVLRYLQRVGGFDVERLRLEMEVRVERSYAQGCNCVLIDGHRYLIKEGPIGPVVVTVLEKGLANTVQQERSQS